MSWKRKLVNRTRQLLGLDNKKRAPSLKPQTLFIEPTNVCNLNCPYCLVNIDSSYPDNSHDSLKRPKGFMDIKLFEKILPEAKAFGIKKIYLEFFGEPFLHPHINQMILKCKKAGFFTGLFTNALPLKQEHFEIIAANVDKIAVSIDGASKETYEQNRIQGNFEQAWKNLLRLNEKCRGTKTRVVWQFIVMRNNEHEIKKAKTLAREHNLDLIFKTFNPSVKKLVSTLGDFQRGISHKPCRSIYSLLAILWDGRVVPCCQDPDGKSIVGDLNESTLTEIWNSEKYKSFRTAVTTVKSKPETEPYICKTCPSYE